MPDESQAKVMTLDEIVMVVSKETQNFRREMKGKGTAWVYNHFYDIQLVEEMMYLICDNPENIGDNETVLRVLSRLCAGGNFLSDYLRWAGKCDSVDVSNVEKAADTLNDFCDYAIKNFNEWSKQ